MDTKKLYFMLAIGVIAGLAIGFPLSRLAQPVKTKTVTKSVVSNSSQIATGMTLTEVLSRLGAPHGATQKGSPANNWVSCLDYRGPGNLQKFANKGDWQIVICAKVK